MYTFCSYQLSQFIRIYFGVLYTYWYFDSLILQLWSPLVSRELQLYELQTFVPATVQHIEIVFMIIKCWVSTGVGENPKKKLINPVGFIVKVVLESAFYRVLFSKISEIVFRILVTAHIFPLFPYVCYYAMILCQSTLPSSKKLNKKNFLTVCCWLKF